MTSDYISYVDGMMVYWSYIPIIGPVIPYKAPDIPKCFVKS